MIQIIAGEKGKGKTTLLIAKANQDVSELSGSLVYLDKSNKHMYELSNKIRLINTREYLITNPDEFLGFICGVLSGNHDIQKIYCDSFLKIACVDEEDLEPVLNKLNDIASHFNVELVICISTKQSMIPATFADTIAASL